MRGRFSLNNLFARNSRHINLWLRSKNSPRGNWLTKKKLVPLLYHKTRLGQICINWQYEECLFCLSLGEIESSFSEEIPLGLFWEFRRSHSSNRLCYWGKWMNFVNISVPCHRVLSCREWLFGVSRKTSFNVWPSKHVFLGWTFFVFEPALKQHCAKSMLAI